MPYASSAHVIDRVESFLRILASTKSDTMTWRSTEPKKLQYYLHCGLSAAKITGHSDFRNLKNTWRVSVRGDLVIAKRKSPNYTETTALEITDAYDFFSIMTNLVRYKDLQSTIHFPAPVNLDEREVEKLRLWCEANEFIFKYSEGALSVQKL
jgi:hypothetical protein